MDFNLFTGGTMEPWKIVTYVAWYLFNVPLNEIINTIYDNPAEIYFNEKYNLIMEDRLKWYLDLDEGHRKRLVDLAIEKYVK